MNCVITNFIAAEKKNIFYPLAIGTYPEKWVSCTRAPICGLYLWYACCKAAQPALHCPVSPRAKLHVFMDESLYCHNI